MGLIGELSDRQGTSDLCVTGQRFRRDADLEVIEETVEARAFRELHGTFCYASSVHTSKILSRVQSICPWDSIPHCQRVLTSEACISCCSWSRT